MICDMRPLANFFERGLNVPAVAMISGHRDLRMLFRYTHPKARGGRRKGDVELSVCRSDNLENRQTFDANLSTSAPHL
jgi:hypothetical protein